MRRSIGRTVNATAVRNEANVFQFIHEVLERLVCDGEQFRFQKTSDYPIGIPVV